MAANKPKPLWKADDQRARLADLKTLRGIGYHFEVPK